MRIPFTIYMIDHINKLIFIHIPGTGGTSIEHAIQGDVTNYHLHGKHYNSTMIYNQVGKDIWNLYSKFTVIRNPWDRMITLWMQPAFGTSDPPGGKCNPIGYRAGKSLEFFLENYSPFPWEHGKLYCDYIQHDIDVTIRFEQRDVGINKLQGISGYVFPTIPHINKTHTRKRHYTYYYNKRCVDMVTELFSNDIVKYKYIYGE